MSENEKTREDISFYQGGEKINGENCIKKIEQKLADLSNIKNINYLIGAGASSGAIPSMEKMREDISKEVVANDNGELKSLYESINNDNLEKTLNILYARKYYLEGCDGTENKEKGIVNQLIDLIQEQMHSKININLECQEAIITLDLYKAFYQKITLRNKDLARVNVFTTNYDLFNEKALDDLNINYNNGFGGGLERVFNPARFRYTFSKRIDANLEKFEPIENMVYLYKLHGSINWIEKEGNSLFNIQEIPITCVSTEEICNHALIYPTPLKQNQSLGSPYSDLIREFQTKLSLPNSVLFIIGYSFRDEHLNNIIYQVLASNSSISIAVFGNYPDSPLSKINDSRIYRIFGEDSSGKQIDYFEYIVNSLLPNSDENKDNKLLDKFIKALKRVEKEGNNQ